MDLSTFSGIRLDVGSGAQTRPGWVGLDNRSHPAVTIVHDLDVRPWPLPDESAVEAFAGFVIARVTPVRWGFFHFMNEIWRILKPDAVLTAITYYGVNSRYLGDPAACNPVVESTFYHFDPSHPSELWYVYQPKPWQIIDLRWTVDGNIEAALRKVVVDV